MPDTIKLTPSGIDDFEACPLHYSLKYVQQPKPGPIKPSPQLALGNSVHDCLYLFHKEGGHQVHTREGMAKLLERGWVSRGYSGREDELSHQSEALRMCEAYHSAFQDEPVQQLGSELFLKRVVRIGDLSVTVSGKVDRLTVWPDGRLEVIDYKTTAEAEPSPAKLAWKLCTFLYFILARTNYPDHARVEVSYIYLRGMRKVTAVYDEVTGAECKKRLVEAVQQISAGDFPARPNQRCAWCEFTDACPSTQHDEIDLDQII
jgi:RecB family exonuclease